VRMLPIYYRYRDDTHEGNREQEGAHGALYVPAFGAVDMTLVQQWGSLPKPVQEAFSATYTRLGLVRLRRVQPGEALFADGQTADKPGECPGEQQQHGGEECPWRSGALWVHVGVLVCVPRCPLRLPWAISGPGR